MHSSHVCVHAPCGRVCIFTDLLYLLRFKSLLLFTLVLMALVPSSFMNPLKFVVIVQCWMNSWRFLEFSTEMDFLKMRGYYSDLTRLNKQFASLQPEEMCVITFILNCPSLAFAEQFELAFTQRVRNHVLAQKRGNPAHFWDEPLLPIVICVRCEHVENAE